MSSLRVSLRPLLRILLTLICPSLAWGQVIAVTTSTSTPIPGAGHDYIKLLSETVDPANGSLSLRLQVPVPQGRGMSVPFSFAYDSNGTVFPIPSPGGPGLSSWGVAKTDSGIKLVSGGWGHSLPLPSFCFLYQVISNGGGCVVTTEACFLL